MLDQRLDQTRADRQPRAAIPRIVPAGLVVGRVSDRQAEHFGGIGRLGLLCLRRGRHRLQDGAQLLQHGGDASLSAGRRPVEVALPDRSGRAAHSNVDPPAIAGVAEVVRDGHPDPTAFDPKEEQYDPKSDPDQPVWSQVAIRAVRAIDPPLGLPLLRSVPALKGMELLRKGSRLSIQPVTAEEWEAILTLAGSGARA
ncbi:MAG: EVE domain-containing protein [Planctomycetaceae bacterium]|nr:EVE domain-containing protein [Planctomycetaceae bacterium]